jgi:hypothetical protein
MRLRNTPPLRRAAAILGIPGPIRIIGVTGGGGYPELQLCERFFMYLHILSTQYITDYIESDHTLNSLSSWVLCIININRQTQPMENNQQ